MINVPKSLHALFQHISEDTTIITPNRRLAATLHNFFQQQQLEQQRNFWRTPDILPISPWIERLWSDANSKSFEKLPVLLNAAQEQKLWENIIQQFQNNYPLIQIAETAQTAQKAANLIIEWEVDINDPLFTSSNDYIIMKEWFLSFKRACSAQNAINFPGLIPLISSFIKKNHLIAPKKLILVGFTEPSPQLKKLLSACKEMGSIVYTYDLCEINGNPRYYTLNDSEEELYLLARWAKQMHSDNPESRIGCVIPTLSKQRDYVVDVFNEVFEGDDIPYNISAGKPLNEFPLISHALQFLKINPENMSVRQFGSLLSSPFLGEAENERILRAKFNAKLHSKNISALNLVKILHNSTTCNSRDILKLPPKLSIRLEKFSLGDESALKKSYHEWADIFNQKLAALGWPGERTLNSEEYQLIDHWLHLLQELSTLDHVAEKSTYQNAMRSLESLARNTVFQPKSPEAPIQILGLLEAAGMPFDYLWISGIDDTNWPPQPKPNPFIPTQLQRELEMPHASSEKALNYCIELTDQFSRASENVIFSHAKTAHDIETNRSPLLNQINEASDNDLRLAAFVKNTLRIFESKEIESIEDNQAPSVNIANAIRGGVDIIKQQALCPFKAFTTYRLNARELEEALPGIRAKDRGRLIHLIMESLWRHLKNQETLINLSEYELHKQIDDAIDEMIVKLELENADNRVYISIERNKLRVSVRELMRQEALRPPFSVYKLEDEHSIKINNLSFNFRIDRIDQVNKNQYLIIDFKSGKYNNIKQWFGDSPDDPQLPLYTMINMQDIIGISYVQIHTNKIGFIGIAKDNLDIDGIKSIDNISRINEFTWDQIKDNWMTIFGKLSGDFLNGIALADPKSRSETCKFCAFDSLCRIRDTVTVINEGESNE